MHERVIPEAVAARTSLASLFQDLKQEGWAEDQEIIVTMTAGKYKITQHEDGDDDKAASTDNVTIEDNAPRKPEPVTHEPIGPQAPSRAPEPYAYTPPEPDKPKVEDEPKPPQRRGSK